MPPIQNIVITPEILTLIAGIHEFKGRWTTIANLAPAELWRGIATIESVGSSTRIDGARLSDAEVEKLIAGWRITRAATRATRDEQEVAGYADAMKLVLDKHKKMPLTEDRIKELHRELLAHTSNDIGRLGEYKSVSSDVEIVGPDRIHRRVIFRTVSPVETPTLMTELVDWYNESMYQGSQHPLMLIGIFIAVFLSIHPFEHGNGHLSRILTTLLLLRAGYDYVPYSSMEKIIESRKEVYYGSLRDTLQTIRTNAQNWEPWLAFFLRMMVKQTEDLAAKLNEEAEHNALPALSRQILQFARIRGEITIRDIEDATHSNRNTIKLHVKKLAGQHYLTQVGSGRGARYVLFQRIAGA